MKKTDTAALTSSLCLAVMLIITSLAYSQGPLDPPNGAPAPNMKSLQEIWDKINELEAQNQALTDQLNSLTRSLGGPFSMDMVSVGNSNNAADTTGAPNPAGAVSYTFKIGKFEVTNEQYARFLNAVAATDPNNLYETNMGANVRGGITRSGSDGSFSYTSKAFMANKPVNFVNWFDAARFCNWLHNSQPRGAQVSGTTEGGAYTLTGTNSVAAGTDPVHGANGRNAGARYWLPSEDEWYKAAYHEPGADANDYWFYPTRSNSLPTQATADLSGNISNASANVSNYNQGADWNGQNGNLTTVGSGGAGSASFYGAFDIGGNVDEWNEQIISTNRGVRGGAWLLNENPMKANVRSSLNPVLHFSDVGIRVAGLSD